MQKRNSIREVFLLALIPCLGFVLFGATRIYNERFSRWPRKDLEIHRRNVSGQAAIISPKFVVLFEGEKWGEMGEVGGAYPVDGRYGGLFPPDSDPLVIQEGSWIFTYEAGIRQNKFEAFKRTIIFRDMDNKLEFGGRQFSTVKPIYLRIKRDNNVQTLDSKVVLTQIQSLKPKLQDTFLPR